MNHAAKARFTVFLLIVSLLVVPKPYPVLGSDFESSKFSVGDRLELESPVVAVTGYLRMGKDFLAVGRYDSALYHFLGAIRMLEHGDADSYLGRAYAGLGMVYQKLGDPVRALQYYEKAEALIVKHGSCADVSNLYIDIGLALVDEEKIDTAFYSFQKAVSVCRPKCSDSILMRLYAAEGTALLKKADFGQALSKLGSGLAIARRLNDKRVTAEILVRQSGAYYELGNYEVSGDILAGVEDLAYELELNEVLLEVYRQQGLLMARWGDVRSQSEYQSKFIGLSERLYNEQIMARLVELEIEFEERGNIKVIEQQKRALELSNITMQKKKRLIFLGAVCVALGTIIAIMLVRAVRRKKRTINSLVGEVEDATAMLEDRMRQEHNAEASKDMELRSALQKMKADVASLLGICMVASRCAADEQTKARFGQVQHDLSELKRRLEGL